MYCIIAMYHLRNEFDFWNVHGIMNTLDLLQSYVKPFAKVNFC